MFFARIVYAKARTRALQRTAPGRLRVSRLLLPADPPRSNRATLRRPSAVSELESLGEEMTTEDIMRIAQDWLDRSALGHDFKIASIEIQDDLAVAYWTTQSGELVAGNAPLLIDCKTGIVHVTGTAWRTSEYVNNFRITGDPQIKPIAVVRMSGWREGARKVTAVTILKENSDLGLAGAKASVDAVLAGEAVEIIPCAGAMAEVIGKKLAEAGFVATVILRAPK